MTTDRKVEFVRAAASTVALLLLVAQSFRYIRLERQEERERRGLHSSREKSVTPITFPGGIEATLNRTAQDANVRGLLSVSSAVKGPSPDVDIEWEADLRSTLEFLRLAGASGLAANIPRFSLSGSEDETGVLKGRATFRVGEPKKQTTPFPATGRDPFHALWKNDIHFARRSSESLRRQESARLRSDEKIATEQRAAEAELEKRARQRAFETRYALTGIVSDGRGPLAFLTGENQRAYMLRSGGKIDDATVTAINAPSGQVRLENGEGFSITLSIGAAGRQP